MILFRSLAFTLPCFALIVRASTSLTWGNCSTSDPPRLQCTQLEVPLDWANPDGLKITLGIARFQAAEPQSRIGSLLFNPGGPGGRASTFIEGQANGHGLFSNDTLKHFDIIGMDPRGLGLSSPIKCDLAIMNERVSYFPTTEGEFEQLVSHNKRFGESCLNLTGPLLGHIDTVSVAHDMEALRATLGEVKLNYLGLSYGTQLGSQYAELYPENIRAMVLDSNTDHGVTQTSMFVTESSTAEDEFKRFALYCSTTPECALYGKNVTDLFLGLIEQASIDPIPAPGCTGNGDCRTNVTSEDILFGVQTFLVFKVLPPAYYGLIPGWLDFGQAISDALSGDATAFSGPVFNTTTADHFSGLAIECLDWTHKSANSLSKLKYKRQLASVISPITHGASQTYNGQAACVGWPVPVTNPPHRMNISTPNTILMVNSNHDPECSYVWANSLKEQILNSVLLTREGDGHTSYQLFGETTKAIDAYLVNGTIPADNTVLNS